MKLALLQKKTLRKPWYYASRSRMVRQKEKVKIDIKTSEQDKQSENKSGKENLLLVQVSQAHISLYQLIK